jgi:hypothetical protein
MNDGHLISRSRADAEQARELILTVFRSDVPPLTVTRLVELTGLKPDRVRKRLPDLVVRGDIRKDGRNYWPVTGQLAVLDPAAQALADRRVQVLGRAERQAYAGLLGDMLSYLDGRTVPTGFGERAGAARSVLRDVTADVQAAPDQTAFRALRDSWTTEIQSITNLVGNVEQAKRDQSATAEAQNRWRDAHGKKIQLLTQEVTAQRRRLTRKRDSFLDLADDVPMSGGYRYRIPLTRAEIAGYERLGLIETAWIPGACLFRFQSRYDPDIGFERRRERFWEAESETCRVTWSDMAACIHAAINYLDASIQQCNNRLVQLAAEKKRGAPEMLGGQLEIDQ